ncbi:MAG TPA: rhomboid family intramembrane serine protease [Pyrinomonadaceae bacterium]|nr:rhomboid family intramembrane serine protease [Pyrinomonadaceae bacterium]
MCRQCGALVGVGEARCGVCGAPAGPGAAPARPPRPHDRETVHFLRAIVRRPATFTFVFLVSNVFLYLLMALSGGAQGNVLLAYGAKLNSLIDREGQWWRFVTPIFLHVYVPGLGPLHLLSNMYGLFMLGPYVEKLYGSARFVCFWIVTGVAGVAASYLTVRPDLAHRGALGRFLFKAYDVPSAGASGALFGLIGVLFVFGIRFRHELPEGLKRAFGTGMLPTIAINLFIGYFGSGFIDNAAHLGGLACGMLMALFVGYKRVGQRGPVSYAWHLLQAGCLALVVVSFVMAARHFDAPPPRWGNLTARLRQAPGGGQAAQAFVEAVNEGQQALAAFPRVEESRLAAAVNKLERTPGLSAEADALRDELKALLARARALASDRALARRERNRRVGQLDADYTDWQRRFEHWVEAEGRNFNIVLPEEEKQ